MKLAILILCHKNPEQINLFLDELNNNDIEFFIHIDAKSNIENKIMKRANVHFLPEEQRVNMRWGTSSMIMATVRLLKYAKAFRKFDYYWLCSGQDFPIEDSENIINYLSQNAGNNFINFWKSSNYNGNIQSYEKRTAIYYPECIMGRQLIPRIIKRLLVEITGGYLHTFKIFNKEWKLKGKSVKFYYGSQWVCITDGFLEWLLNFLNTNPDFFYICKHSVIPDEFFFQTVFMMSPFKGTQHNFLHYVNWDNRPGKPRNSPNTLVLSDYNNIINSGYLMARKFDLNVDSKVVKALMDKHRT